MKIRQSFTGQTAQSDIQVQKPISHLLIKKTGAAAITDETISIVLQSGGTQYSIATKVKIKDIAIISQFQAGYMGQKVSGADIISEYLLDITGMDAGVKLKDNDYLSLDLAGLVGASAYEIYGIENINMVQAYVNYNTTVISGAESQTKSYSLNRTHQGIYIRNNSALSRLRVFAENGKEASYEPVELLALAREINGITQMADVMIEGDATNQTIAGGGSDFFFYPNLGLTGFEITTEGGTDLTFILVDYKQF